MSFVSKNTSKACTHFNRACKIARVADKVLYLADQLAGLCRKELYKAYGELGYSEEEAKKKIA